MNGTVASLASTPVHQNRELSFTFSLKFDYFQAKFVDFKIQNIVGSCDVKFAIRLEGLVLAHAQFCRYRFSNI